MPVQTPTPARPIAARSRPGWTPVFSRTPLAHALALLALAGGMGWHDATQARAWFAADGAGKSAAANASAAARAHAAHGGVGAQSAAAQQAAAQQKLSRSIANLNRTAGAIAAQQAAQAAAREAALAAGAGVPDGLAEGGMKVDTNPLTAGWLNAQGPVQTASGGKTTVSIQQTADRAILNWETFNVGRNTTVAFQGQHADWAVLNRVNDPQARPSQIQGAIKGDGTVMVVNRNGVVFSGASQVDARNLVAAAAAITDDQFRDRGLYNGANPVFTDAGGKIVVEQGALLRTPAPTTSTAGGGYVLLLGRQVENAGVISTPRGQAALAAGDSFAIVRGQGTSENQASTTRGNQVTATLAAGDDAGAVLNTGVLQAVMGDVTMLGRDVKQAGVALATTSTDTRGTVHLTATGAEGKVTLAREAVTAIVLENTDATALDSQRDALQAPALSTVDSPIVPGDLYRRDLSLVEIASGGAVDFEGGSLTLATGGQIGVQAATRALVRDGAVLDVSGAIGVRVAMESNNLNINVQGNEQRDAPGNRDSKNLNNSDVWLDRRSLVYVAAGTNGYETDRWYTAGGLLEVGGYLATSGRGVGQWMAQGGMVRFAGGEAVTQQGSQINLSGGTLDVQSGYLRQSWLRGNDGRLYSVDRAPGDVLYKGLYQGYEQHSERWGNTRYYRSPLIGPERRYELGYTVGRDAGVLVVGTKSAVLEGELVGDTYQGARQTQAAQAGLDGLYQSQQAVARGGQLVVGSYVPYYVKESGTRQYSLGADGNTIRNVVLGTDGALIAAGLDLEAALPEDRQGTLYLDTDQLNGFELGALRVAATGSITVDGALRTGAGGEIVLYGPDIAVNADLAARGGSIQLGNVRKQVSGNLRDEDTILAPVANARARVVVAEGVTLDASGLWTNLRLDRGAIAGLPFVSGGAVSIRGSSDITLAQGSIIDVSSGAALLADGDRQGGRGGNLTLEANAQGNVSDAALLLDGDLRGHGVSGAGTLALQAPRVVVGGAAVEPGEEGDPAQAADSTAGTLRLSEDFFDKGFAAYRIAGVQSLTVADGAQVDVSRPVYRYRLDASNVAAGQPVSSALELWTPPLYQEDAVAAELTRRAGASLFLRAGGALPTAAQMAGIEARVGQGARVAVDPGQSIEIRSAGQLTVEGRLDAWGGRIELGGTTATGQTPAQGGRGLSIWLGEHAVLDVAARAAVATGPLNLQYGIVEDGGSIVIGGSMNPADGSIASSDLFLVLREGAVLDASGTQAAIDVPGQGRTLVASDGGSISLLSNVGLYLDGELRARAGGAGASGGSLRVGLGAGVLPQGVAAFTELVVSQDRASGGSGLVGAGPAEAADQLAYGRARLAASQAQDGGFDALTLYSSGMIAFDGNVSLTMGRSLDLYAGSLGLAQDAPANSRATLAVPYMLLAASALPSAGDQQSVKLLPGMNYGDTAMQLSTQPVAGRLSLQASQVLDVRGGAGLGVGGRLTIPAVGGTPAQAIDRRGFEHVELASAGDMRLQSGTVYATGDLTLAAAQIYPSTGQSATLYAGWRGRSAAFDPDRTLRVLRTSADLPATPYSAFGSLALAAARVEQGGVLRAPLGKIALGVGDGGTDTHSVVLLPDSVVSASGAGLAMPYGGTVDGVVWNYAGQQVKLAGVGSAEGGSVSLSGQFVDVREGAVIDLTGGGKLSGAGFVAGRGGSTDARMHPLVQVGRDGFTLPGLDTNPVYAIVPGMQAAAAPVDGEAGASAAARGQAITVDAGVPGLPAGTYTLLPSTYALLPGAFRVELNGRAGQGAAGRAQQLRNGSWSAGATLSVAGTEIRDSLSSRVFLTPADVLRTYSQYNETSYTDFARVDAARLGIPRARIEADAKRLDLRFTAREAGSDALSLAFDGTVLGAPAAGGFGSTLVVSGRNIEILSDTAAPNTTGMVAIRASDLNKAEVNQLSIGSAAQVDYGQGGNMIRFRGDGVASKVYVRSGAVLRAPEILLVTRAGLFGEPGVIDIERGAVLSTLGQGAPAYSSADGFIYQPSDYSVVAVSNGRQQWLAPADGQTAMPTPIRVGGCEVGNCVGTTALYSEGSITFATNKDFVLDDTVRYGTRHLSLAVGAFNIGSAPSLEAARARGALAPGLVLNQDILSRLLQGDASSGAPALETLELIAGQSMNFFDTITLSTLDAQGRSLLDNLMLTAPAIYGYGDGAAVARIQTGHLVWNGAGGIGSSSAPGAVLAGGAGTGSGTFEVDARRITFGYGPWGQPDGTSELQRMTLGFADVDLRASERITANNRGTLAVHQAQGEYVAGEGFRYSGGNLNLITPLLTGESGSVNKVSAGGDIRVSAGQGIPADPAAVADLGGELSLSAGRALSLDTTVALPSGQLTLAAEGGVFIGAAARVDMAGRAITFFDDAGATRYSWGGQVNLRSAAGDVRVAQGSVIDLTARHNQAGKLSAIALGEAAGTVDLQGRIVGSASGHYEAGGTHVPYLEGAVEVRAQRLGDGDLSTEFAALNQRLNEGGVFGVRSFQFKQGDLTIQSEPGTGVGDVALHANLKANQIDISVDGGRLTVAGLVDASGERVGSIRLAGKQGLTIAGNGVLDAHGTMLRMDSYGQIIDAPNRAVIELNSGDGLLTLADGARMDLRYGTDDPRYAALPALRDRAMARGPLGTLELFAPRIDAAGNTGTQDAASYGDVAIDARGTLAIQGARSIALNAVQRYDDARDGVDPAADGKPYQVIDQDYLDEKHGDSTDFITHALANGTLLNTELSGLYNAAHRDVLHLRPAVEIVSKTPDGNLVVSGDLDLSRYRYDSLNPLVKARYVPNAAPGSAGYGSGEPGALAIRAGGDLSIYGSINDGFTPPPDTPDDTGWVLTPGRQGYGGDVVVPGPGVELADGTRFPAGKTLNYALPIKATTLAAGTELPAQAELTAELKVPSGTVLSAAVRNADGTIRHAAGTLLANGNGDPITLPAGSLLDAGFRLPAAAALAAMTWPAGVPLPSRASSHPVNDPDGVFLAGALALKVGALIPSLTDVKLADGVISIPLRTVTGGSMGRNWAVAAMLPEGSLSWGLRLVAGADVDAADPRLARADGKGRLVLADTHYSLYGQREIIPGTPPQVTGKWFWTAIAGDFGFVPDSPLTEEQIAEGWCPSELCLMAQYIYSDLIAEFGMPELVGKPVAEADMGWCPDVCVQVGETIPGTPPQAGDVIKIHPVAQNFSVLRTGTGDLDLIAGGDLAMQSLYGVYTAGMSTASRAGGQADAFDRPRARAADGTYLDTAVTPLPPPGAEPSGPVYESLVDGGVASTYAAWYPDGGGNLLLRVGGNLTGDMQGSYNPQRDYVDLRQQRNSVDMGNWLWRQAGGGAGLEAIPASWWINFGTYVSGSAASVNAWKGLSSEEMTGVHGIPELVGFTGIGTLGGGNLTVSVLGDAGIQSRRGSPADETERARSQGLVLAVGSTGRVLADGTQTLTGGGDLVFDVGGAFNPGLEARAVSTSGADAVFSADYKRQNPNTNGMLANLRGALRMQAGESGGVALTYYQTGPGQADNREARAFDAYAPSLGAATGGPVLMLGDAAASIDTRGDLVVAGTGDPGRVALPVTLLDRTAQPAGSYGWFSLWTENTAISLFAAGGDLAPSTQTSYYGTTGGQIFDRNDAATDGRFVWPSQLDAVAARGSAYLGRSSWGITPVPQLFDPTTYSLLLAPSAKGRLALLAGDSIYAGGYTITRSGASVAAMPTPFAPAFIVFPTGANVPFVAHNLAADAVRPQEGRYPLFTFGSGSASGQVGRLAEPTRLYALSGDIIGLGSGEILDFADGARAGQTWYEGAGPVWMRAGRDIVRSGTLESYGSDGAPERKALPGELAAAPGNYFGSGASAGNLFVHDDPTDVSIVQAGRDILYSNFNVAGPGTLEVTAGRHILMAGQAGLTIQSLPIPGEAGLRSLGPVVPGDTRPGAGIVVQAGMGAAGANYADFLASYLDPANLAAAGTPLADQPGKVAKTYEAELAEWLAARYGYDAAADGGDAQAVGERARAWFAALPAEQQRIFARQVYFAELREGGREYNDADGPRLGSYLRGRNAIAALFPEKNDAGEAIVYQGDLLMYGGSGIHTDRGGDIQVLTPGGAQTYGVEGEAPPSTAGVITRGQGDIQMYSLGNILLGQSRIMTTFGGDILAWAAQGDINAGRGSKTTVVYTPPLRVYDGWGNVTLSPQVPSTGAGIATLNPIPEVAPGDVDLIAPLGTIDAGEAGIRVSGNVNIAALQVVNAANIQVQGESKGIPVVAAINVGALSNASAAATTAATAAQDAVARSRAAAQKALPSIISVQVLGFGNEPAVPAVPRQSGQPGAAAPAQPASYSAQSMLQMVGRGETLTPAQLARLSAEERRKFGL